MVIVPISLFASVIFYEYPVLFGFCLGCAFCFSLFAIRYPTRHD